MCDWGAPSVMRLTVFRLTVPEPQVFCFFRSFHVGSES